jgi:hypothetical protein
MESIKSTVFSADCHVNLTQSQDIEQAVKTLAHYIPTISDCFAQLDLDGQWLKTSQGYCQLTTDGLCEEYLAPLPSTGMMQSGNLYHAPTLVAATKESDCLLLPTPKHTDKNTAGVKSYKRGQTKHLSVAVKELLNKSDGYLNSQFVEEIMGFPRYWTDLHFPTDSLLAPKLLLREVRCYDHLDTALIANNTKNNQKSLGQLGNAIVPQVGAIVFDLLSTIERGSASKPLRQAQVSLVDNNKSKVESRKSKVASPVLSATGCALLSLISDDLRSSRAVERSTCDFRLSTFDLPLANLEQIIESESTGIVSFDKVGNALLKIQTEKLYQEKGYTSFIAYCYDRFEISKARIYQLINAAKIMSTIVDINLSGYEITESHCRELAKIKNLEERSLVLKKVIFEGTVTAKAITKTYQAMKLEMIKERSEQYKPNLPSEDTVVRITSKDFAYQKYNGYWGIVSIVHEYSVSISVLDNLLVNVPSQDFLAIGQIEGAVELAHRLSIIELANTNDTVKQIIKAIATKPYPCLDEIEEVLLETIEKTTSYKFKTDGNLDSIRSS